MHTAYLHTPVGGEPVGGADLPELAGEIPEELGKMFFPLVPSLEQISGVFS